METSARYSALAVTVTQLVKGTSIETELAFLDSLTSSIYTSRANDFSKEDSPLQNGGVVVYVTHPSEDSSVKAADDSYGNVTQNNKRQSLVSGCADGGEDSLISATSLSSSKNNHDSNAVNSQDQNSRTGNHDKKENTSLPAEIDPALAECSSDSRNNGDSCSNNSSILSHCKSDLALLCHDPSLVAEFLEYVFTRRYGRADRESLEDKDGGSGQMPTFYSQAEESLNEKMDAVINSIVEQPVTAGMAGAFEKLLDKAANMPTVRYKTVEHVVVWLSGVGSRQMDVHMYRAIKSLILTGVSDVWSAVRKSCSSGLPFVFHVWGAEQQQDFFESLLEICINSQASWQAKDGAALCVSAIMHSCFSVQVAKGKVLNELPSFVVECVLTIVFSLISHPQLSIRETVAKIMSAYIQHVDTQDMVDLLHQTLTLLTPVSGDCNVDGFQCVEAYAAEGLLNICISIFRVLPIRQAVRMWPTCRESFLTYLTHEASSVRQTSSTLFLRLASKPACSAVLMKIVLRHLVKDWSVAPAAISSCTDFLPDVDDGVKTWEAREGRMFVYELLCKHLIENHLQSTQSSPTLPEACDGSPRSTRHPGGDRVFEVYTAIVERLRDMSCLSQLRFLDDPLVLSHTVGVQVLSDEEYQNFHWWQLVSCPCQPDGSGEVETWMKDSDLPTFNDLLLTMLHHTALCLAHTQWELRRIAQQVLPHLCEVMCLYDVELIMSVWSYASETANLWSFLGLYALHESLMHCAKVVSTADLSDKTSALKDCAYGQLVDGVRKHVEDYLPLVCSHLQRPVFDKLSVIAVEVALLAINLFDLDESLKQDLCRAVLSLWMNLFIFAHPNNAIAESLLESPAVEFVSPHEGFLSCCLVRPESRIQCARQVEKTMITSIHKHLGHFLPQLDKDGAALTLPVLAHNIAYFIDDTEICKSLINSFGIVCQCTSMSLSSTMNHTDSDNSFDKPLKCVYFTLRELAAVVAMKSLDLILLQKVLGCYTILCRLLNPAVHLPLLLRGVCARMNEQGRAFRLDTAHDLDPSVDLRWHKVEAQVGAADQSGDSSILDASIGHDQSETDSLNQSGSSYNARLCPRMGRRRTLSISGDTLLIHEVTTHLGEREGAGEDAESESSGSEWDSWSEEEQDAELSAVKIHFQDFFKQILGVYGHECYHVFETEKRHLSRKDQDLLASLLEVYPM